MRRKTDLELSIEHGMEICVPDLPGDTEPDPVPKQTIELKDGTVIDVTEARIKLLRQRDELRAALALIALGEVNHPAGTHRDAFNRCKEIARAALANTND